jgi:hypothetical protein
MLLCACLPACFAPQRAQLAEYDDNGSGELDVLQLQQYLTSVAARAPLLAGMEVRPCCGTM